MLMLVYYMQYTSSSIIITITFVIIIFWCIGSSNLYCIYSYNACGSQLNFFCFSRLRLLLLVHAFGAACTRISCP